jgi:hypothetical protein
MNGIQCPRCGREATGGGRFWRGGKPYCPSCGWNVDKATTVGATNQNLATVYFVAMAIFLAVIGAAVPSAGKNRVSFIAFAFVLLILAVVARYRAKSQKSMQSQYPVAAQSAPTPFAMSASPGSMSYERLLMLRRPRAIRMKTSHRIFAVANVIGFAGVGFAIFAIVEKGGAKANFSALPNLLPFAMFGLIWSIIAGNTFRAMARDHGLLSDGEIAIATVTAQSFAGGESRGSRITYEFKDASGRTFSGKATDQTRKVFEEMQTPVFYDPMNPAKNIALVGATYNLVES